VGLIIAIVVTLILGLVASPVIKALTTEKQRATNVLLSAIPFILIFVAILLTFISLINMSASVLNDNISPRIHSAIEKALIAGIVLGIFGMFQPWLMLLFKVGFMVLLISTLGFIWWSHIKPKKERRQKEAIQSSRTES
jgi:predicted lipid-binding transport protein (Tim44 family)